MYFNTENGREIFINSKERYIDDIVVVLDNDNLPGSNPFCHAERGLIGNKHNV